MEEVANENSFFSIMITPQGEEDEDDASNSVILPPEVLRSSNMIRVRSGDAPSRTSVEPSTLKHPEHLLKWRHPQVPLPRAERPVYRFPEVAGQNPFW